MRQPDCGLYLIPILAEQTGAIGQKEVTEQTGAPVEVEMRLEAELPVEAEKPLESVV
jgi:hypothetical protein